MNIQKPTEKIPTPLLVGNGSEKDTQFREIQLGEKTESGAECIGKFLIVVLEKDGEKQILPVGNVKSEYFTPEFIKEILDTSRDKWLQISKFRNEKTL